MKHIILFLLGFSLLQSYGFAQMPSCEKINELTEWSKENFRAIRGAEAGRRKEQSGREIVNYKVNVDVEGLQQLEIVYDFEWFIQGRFGDFFNDRESALDEFKKLTQHLKECLPSYKYKETDKNINEIYEYKGGFTPQGGESATIAAFIQRDARSKKYFVQLWVKGLKRPY